MDKGYCIFCGHEQGTDMLDISTSGTFQGVGYLNCKNKKCNAGIKFFVEDWPKSKAAVSKGALLESVPDAQMRLDQ